MTDKELRKLNRKELLEILFYLQKEIDEMKEENNNLNQKIAVLTDELDKAKNSVSENNLSEVMKTTLNNRKYVVQKKIHKDENPNRIFETDLISISENIKNTVDSSVKSQDKKRILTNNDFLNIVRNTVNNSQKFNDIKNALSDEDLRAVFDITKNMYRDCSEESDELKSILLENDMQNIVAIMKSALKDIISIPDSPEDAVSDIDENISIDISAEFAEKFSLSEDDMEKIIAFVKESIESEKQKNMLSPEDLESISRIVNSTIDYREQRNRTKNILSANDLINIYDVIKKALKNSGSGSDKNQIKLKIMQEQAKGFFEKRRSEALWQNKK